MHHIQNSVFEGDISEAKFNQLIYELKPLIREDIDSVIIFKSRNKKWLNKTFLGKKEDNTSNFL